MIPCSTKPCENDGICSNSPDFSGYTCDCETRFTGVDCETEIPCLMVIWLDDAANQTGAWFPSGFTEPCFNNGSCSNSMDFLSYTCDCGIDFTGDYCETRIPCSLDPCLNEGVCVDSADFIGWSS